MWFLKLLPSSSHSYGNPPQGGKGGGEVKLLLPTEVSFNALSPSSDQQQFSPNDIHTFSDLPQTLTLALYSFFEILPRGAGHSNLC